jgi:cell wall-associated NlpC family hydrolase
LAAKAGVPVLLATAAVLTAVVPAGVGSAAPASRLRLSTVQTRITALNARAERVTEAYDGARGRLTALQRQERASTDALRADQARVTETQARVADEASAAYRSGGLDATLTLVANGTPQTYLDRTASLDLVSRYEADEVAAAAAAQRQLAAAVAVHDAQVAEQRATVSAIGSERSQVQDLLSQQRQLLGRLKAADRRRLAAAAAQRTRAQTSLRTSDTSHATGQAAAAVRFAYAQLGKPYVYGGAGPSAYDCSGLTMAAWGAAGVGLAHNAAAQQASIPAVSLSALAPGDLVFFGSPAYHVALYIGGGRMIQAPHTGASVEITPVSYMSPSGAGRP